MFLYERDEHMRIRRLEDKLGIHGSPTCELQFDDAPALLVGERRRGLTTYVMSLMNGARLAIAAQAQGIAEAAYRAAAKYAGERVQFGAPIGELTAVKGMLADMKVSIEAARALLYETALIVDIKEVLEHRIAQLQAAEKAGEASPAGPDTDAQGAARRAQEVHAARRALHAAGQGLLHRDGQPGRPTTRCRSTAAPATCATSPSSATPATRASPTSTRARRSCRSWPPSAACSAARSPTGSTSTTPRTSRRTPELLARVRAARARLAEAIARVRELDDVRFRDFHARRLVEMAIDVICGYLLLRAAQDDARKLLAAQYFVDAMTARVEGAAAQVLGGDPATLDALTTLAAG